MEECCNGLALAGEVEPVDDNELSQVGLRIHWRMTHTIVHTLQIMVDSFCLSLLSSKLAP